MLPSLHATPNCRGTYELISDELANPQVWQCPSCRASQYQLKELTTK